LFKPLQETASIVNYGLIFAKLLKYMLNYDADDNDALKQSQEILRNDVLLLERSASESKLLETVASGSLLQFFYLSFSEKRLNLIASDHWNYSSASSLCISNNTLATPRSIARVMSKLIYFIRSVVLCRFCKDIGSLTSEQ
jgi:hypothetical protein